MLISLLIRVFPFNDKFNGVFKNTYNKNDVSVIASGSQRCYSFSIEKTILTKPESVIDPDDKLEWCSNLNRSATDFPWLAAVFNNKKLSITGYSLKTGCCEFTYDSCCCMPYSWSVLGSNNNKTWTKIHSIEKEANLKICQEKSYRVDKKGSFSMIKLIQDESEQGCLLCLSLSKLEFYGELEEKNEEEEETTSEDEVSIIGRVKRT